MKNVEKHINDIISKVLSEQVAVRTEEIMSMANEELHGNQKKLDKNKNNEIDADDFKKLRGEMGEDDVDTQWMDDEKLAKNEPLYRGTKFVDKSEMQEYSFGDTATDDDLSYNDMLPSAKYEKEIKTPHKVKNVGDKFQRKVSKKFSEGEIEENIFKKMFGKKDDSEEKDKEEHKKGNSSLWDAGYDYDDIRGWHMPAPGQHRFDRDKSDKKEVEEYYIDDEEEDAEELSQDEPTYVGKGLADNKIKNKIRNKFVGSFDEEVDEEAETEEGNAFTGALAKAKESGDDSFEVDGKEYNVNESENKFIQNANMKKGGLHKALGIPEGEKIPKSKLNSIKKDLMAKAKGDKKLSAADSKLLKQVNMALTLGSLKESRNTLSLSEDELIGMIENIVKEQIVKDPAEKNNFSVKEPQGLKKTIKAQDGSKKENDAYAKDVVKKMKDYMKDMFSGGKGYDENPDDFPQSNYDMEKEHNEMKYHPSDAVDEYIEAFSYPGMTNLVYDEIKPDDEMITKQIKGDSKNGNAITGKDGKALGNVSKRSEKVGDRFKKNFDDNLYGAEQMNVSYKRQSQPVDVAGSKRQNGSLKSIKAGSTEKANKIMNQLESTEAKATKIINEDLQKMKDLISYNRKTQ